MEREPYFAFAFDAEELLRQSRAEMCACHTILATRRLVDEDVIDAISHLVAATYSRLDNLMVMHAQAFEAAQERRAA